MTERISLSPEPTRFEARTFDPTQLRPEFRDNLWWEAHARRFAAYAAYIASGDEVTATVTSAIALILNGERLPAPDERPVRFVLRIIHSVTAEAIARALDERWRGSPD
jgi:hypothetical protein